MILPWHTDLFQPGRMVCVVFRASPLIWPTSSGATHAPRPLFKVTPGGFPRGAMGVGGKAPLPLGSTYRSTGWGEGLHSANLIACRRTFHPM